MSLVPQRDPGELRVRVGVLDRQPATGQHADAAGVLRGAARPCGRDAAAPPASSPRAARRSSRRAPAAWCSRSVALAYWNANRPLSQFHSSLTAGSSPARRRMHLAAPVVGALGAAGRAVLARARRGDQVERPGPEPVLRAGQRADRADLDRVAGEVGVERRVVLGHSGCPGRRRSARCDERSIRSMNLSPAISSENRVQRWHSTHRSRSSSTWVEIGSGLGYSRLCSTNRLSDRPVRHRLVLQRALAALVAHRAVQRVVDQEELHDALLRLLGHRQR